MMNNAININENSRHFRRLPSVRFEKTVESSVSPKLYEQEVTEVTTTTTNKETNTITDEMTRTHVEKGPVKRVNLVTGPRSAFARLFPSKCCRREQRSKSTEDQRYNFDRTEDSRILIDNDRPRRISYYDQQNTNHYLSEQNLSRIPLNYDPNPEVIYHDNPNKLVYVQKVGVRYLKPPTPPPPEPIIIREVQAARPREPPPLVISTTPPIPPRTPSPIIVREEPPIPPPSQPTKVITKTLPPLPTPPRRVIIKRVPPLPAKPRPVIIEKWLPYKTPPERPVVYQRAEQINQNRSSQRNVILQYEPARVRVEQEIQNVGCYRVDPEIYRAQFGSSLRRTDSIRKVLEDIGCNPNIITSNGYKTCYPSTATTTTTQYDYPKETRRTYYTDEQSNRLINSSNYHYDKSTTTSRDNNQLYYPKIVSNS